MEEWFLAEKLYFDLFKLKVQSLDTAFEQMVLFFQCLHSIFQLLILVLQLLHALPRICMKHL